MLTAYRPETYRPTREARLTRETDAVQKTLDFNTLWIAASAFRGQCTPPSTLGPMLYIVLDSNLGHPPSRSATRRVFQAA